MLRGNRVDPPSSHHLSIAEVSKLQSLGWRLITVGPCTLVIVWILDGLTLPWVTWGFFTGDGIQREQHGNDENRAANHSGLQ